MKKIRKGFTLVELLIVIAILGALAATMATSSQKATGLAKAQAIVNNVNACKTAAILYYSEHREENLKETTSSAFLTAGSEFVPNWSEFSSGGTTYTAGDGKGFGSWDVKIDFTNDADAKGITTALAKIRGYAGVGTGTGLKVELFTGKVSSADATPAAGGNSSGG